MSMNQFSFQLALALLSAVTVAGFASTGTPKRSALQSSTLNKTSFAGTVQSVDLTTNRLQVIDDAGHRLQLTPNPSTEILKNHKPVSLSELQPKDPVIVRYWEESKNP
jgi:hypothetical protein